MDITILIFLTSGLFLGWSLGANDAANVFGTAVGTGMVRFATAAAVCSLFVILGAVISGAGAAHTLGKLGAVNAIAGSFMAAFSAALTVYWMTKLGLPVSTSQAVVGAIIGWNLFTGNVTDLGALTKIMMTWIACPVLAAIFAAPLFVLTGRVLKVAKLHLFKLDALTRTGLVLAGALGSYSLGANNIANVMGVFVPASPFTAFDLGDIYRVTSIQQLFFLGAVAIGVGVFTYSKKVMMTVGGGLLPLSPIGAWVVVIAQSIVLLLFSSEELEHLLAASGLPTIPLVPVSSSQAVIGAVIGIGLLKGGRAIRWRVLGNISTGWVTTPIISAVICFVMLFFLQNVFDQQVYKPTTYALSPAGAAKLVAAGADANALQSFVGQEFDRSGRFVDGLRKHVRLSTDMETKAIDLAQTHRTVIDARRVDELWLGWMSDEQRAVLKTFDGRGFDYTWELQDALSAASPAWKMLPQTKVNKLANKEIKERFQAVFEKFAIEE